MKVPDALPASLLIPHDYQQTSPTQHQLNLLLLFVLPLNSNSYRRSLISKQQQCLFNNYFRRKKELVTA